MEVKEGSCLQEPLLERGLLGELGPERLGNKLRGILREVPWSQGQELPVVQLGDGVEA